MDLFARKDNVCHDEQFWNWFVVNKFRLASVRTDDTRLIDELSRALSHVDRGLTCEIRTTEDGRHQFAVSADGNRYRFPDVQRLVAAAPSMPNWDVVAFRQRKAGQSWTVKIDEVTLDVNDIWFWPTESGDAIDLTLFVRGLTPDNYQTVTEASYMMLDWALGEYDLEMHVGHLDWQPLPVDPVSAWLKPFWALPDYVDGKKQPLRESQAAPVLRLAGRKP